MRKPRVSASQTAAKPRGIRTGGATSKPHWKCDGRRCDEPTAPEVRCYLQRSSSPEHEKRTWM